MEFINSYEQVQELIDTKKPFFIYKHSTQCPISANAKKEFERFLIQSDADYVAVKVIEDRETSNEIADITGVKHESPQAILMSGNEVLWHESHRKLTADEFEKQWNKNT